MHKYIVHIILLILSAFIVILLIRPALTEQPSVDCAEMRREDYRSVSSKGEIERLIENEIFSRRDESAQIDWNCLIEGFRAMGEDFSVEYIPNGGFDNADIVRFSVDNSNVLTNFTSAPGASNGIFTAIINRTSEGQVAIVERGGQLRWLRLE